MRGVLAAAFCFLLSPVVAHTQSDELAVVEHLVRMIMSSPEWEDTPRVAGDGESGGRGLTPLFNEYEELFSCAFPSNHVGFSWSPQERRVAFENFIAAIPELSTNGQYRAIETHGSIALTYCRDFGATNALSAAMRILSDAQADARGSIWIAALDVFEEFATPTGHLNAFAALILTNKTQQTALSRKYFLGAYVNALNRSRCTCEPVDFTNGIAIARAGVYGWAGSVAVDKLLLESYLDYAISSNRLALAVSALNATEPNERYWDWALSIREYFAPITNQLLNATQPLPEVEALRGL